MVWLPGHLGQAVTVPHNGGARFGVRPHWWHSKMDVQIKALQSLSHCRDVEFRCSSGQCISKQEMCDGRKSCDDGSDESPSLCGGATQLRPGEQISGEFTTSRARIIFQLCDSSYCGQIVVTGVRKNGKLILHTGRECNLQGEYCINDYNHDSLVGYKLQPQETNFEQKIPIFEKKVSTDTDDIKVGTIERFRVQNQNSSMVLFFGDNFDRAAVVPVDASSRNFSVRMETNERLKVRFTEITPMELVERDLVQVDNQFVFSSQLCEPVLCTKMNVSSVANVVCKYKEEICLVNTPTDSLPKTQETQIVSPNRPRRTPPTPRFQTSTPRQFLEEVRDPISLDAVKKFHDNEPCFWEAGSYGLVTPPRSGKSRGRSHLRIEHCSKGPQLARHHIIPYNLFRAFFSTAVVAHLRFQYDGFAAVGSIFPLTELLIDLAGMATSENTGYRQEELNCAHHSALLARQNDDPRFLKPLNGYMFFWMVSNIVVGPAPRYRGDDPKEGFDVQIHRLLEENDTLQYWAIDGLHSAIQRYMEVIRPYIHQVVGTVWNGRPQ
ncbi:uncharacterized protein LOC117647716 [Thrips palmi]|uniref:Uncharacterized protein LOC117647716 n=1 Tax=Thrips palmi TaxID=161013 RepID=A0A6P8Z5V9_THRPL|nr:uncharacterized protein LOC117647716 [Thrips palmi]